MGLAPSTFYDTLLVPLDGDELLARIGAIATSSSATATAGSGQRCATGAWW
jgi:hypothetical protein